jgi:hypothetical protein
MIFPQIQASHDPGQGAIRDVTAVFALEDLLDPDDIALGAAEDLPEDGRKFLVGRLSLRPLLPLPPDHTSDRVSGELKDLADLPDLHSLLKETQNGLLDLLGDHRHHTS